ncbi:peptidylprolyl isomerase [Chloroflexota bacterium]
MSQSKKKRPDSRSVEKVPSSKAVDATPKGRRTAFIIASVVIVLILVIVGVGYYFSEDAKYGRLTIITVDDISIKMPYFLKRAQLGDVDSITLLNQLTHEQLIKLEAPQYIGELTPEDIDQGLRITASGGSGNISESEFKEWYRQQLNESKLSDTEYKEIIRIGLLTVRLHEYLAERVPTAAEQVHLHIILVETYEDAQEVRARWEAGEDFADLAREVSVDEQSKEKGGELGWFPRGVLTPDFDYTAFSLDMGDVSEPFPFYPYSETDEVLFSLLMVSEKAAVREIDEGHLQILRVQVLTNWLTQEMQFHEIKFNFNSEIAAWIGWQVAKTNPSSSGTSEGQ